MDFEEPFERADSSDFLAKATALMPKVNVLVLSDYAKGSLYDCQALIALARRHKVPVLVDPKGNDFSRYRGADILTPNLQELEKDRKSTRLNSSHVAISYAVYCLKEN